MSVRKILLYSMSLLIFGGIIGAGAGYFSSRNDTANDSDVAVEDVDLEKELTEQEQIAITKAQSVEAAAPTKTGEPKDPDAPLPSPDVQLEISKSDDTVIVKTQVQNVTSGQCELRIVNGASTLSKSAELMYQAEYSSCAGFSIPVSELSSGVSIYTLSITPSSGDELVLTKEFSL